MTTKDSTSGVPTFGQIIVWTFIAGLFGTIFTFIGKGLSDKPIEEVVIQQSSNTLSPNELNVYIDELLAKGSEILNHDASSVQNLSFLFYGTCLLIAIASLFYILSRKKKKEAKMPNWHTTIIIIVLVLIPIVTSILIKAKEKSLLQGKSITEKIFETTPKTIMETDEGKMEISFLTNIQSNREYYKVDNFQIDSSYLISPSETIISIDIKDANMSGGGTEPGNTDFIPLMQNVSPEIEFTLPNKTEYQGYFLVIYVTVDLRVTSDGGKSAVVSERAKVSNKIRISREAEANFINDYSKLSSKLGRNIWIAFIFGLIVFISIRVFLDHEYLKKLK